jgi:hypothetical protein
MVLLEGFELNILCMTDEVGRVEVVGTCRCESAGCSFLGLPLMPQLSLLVLS